MKYKNIVRGKFISRPNRFIAHVEIDGREEICHVMNTGRMRELLLPGAELFLSESENPARKTRFDLVAVRRGGEIVNIDSLAPNKVAAGYIPTLLRGAKHLDELIAAKAGGFRAAVRFVIAMKGVASFAANAATDPRFASALGAASAAGVEVYAIDCEVSPSEILPGKPMPGRI